MSNLLPETYQKNLWRSYRARFIAVGSSLFIVAGVASALAILPTYIILFTTRPAQVAQTAVQQNQKDLADVATVQMLTQQYAPLIGASSTVSVLEEVLSLRPKGVHLDHISYAAQSPAIFVISGTAESRDSMNSFREALSADKRFASVSLPVGDLVGAQGGRFTVTLAVQM